MQDGGVIPDSGFPWDGGMANEERARNKRARCKHIVQLIQHAFVHGHRLRVIPSKRAFWGESSSSKEVDVLSTVAKVVVLAGRRGSSCTRKLVGSTTTVAKLDGFVVSGRSGTWA